MVHRAIEFFHLSKYQSANLIMHCMPVQQVRTISFPQTL